MDHTGIKASMDSADWSKLVLLSVLWGGAFFLVEIALDAFSPWLIVAARMTIAALLLWLIVLAKRYPVPAAASVWLLFVGTGLLNNVIPLLLIAWAQTEITAGLAAILIATTPVIGVALAGLFLRDEPITRRKLAGTVVGFLGVAILIGPAVWSGFGRNVIAQLAVLAAAVSFALAGVCGRRFATVGVHPMTAAAGQLLASAVVALSLLFIFEGSVAVSAGKPSAWAALAALALLSTALGYVIYYDLLQSAGAVNLLQVNLLLPATAILLGTVVLGERLDVWQMLGLVVIVSGLVILDGRAWQRPRARTGD